jgi:hypothetical protein
VQIQYYTFALTLLTAIITCYWTIRNWILQRADYPKIDLTCTAKLVTSNSTHKVIEVIAEINNTGNVRHIFSNMTYSAYGHDLLKLKNGKRKNLKQVTFPYTIRKDQEFFPSSWEYSFVDAGVKAVYKQIICVPSNLQMFQFHVKMRYKDKESDFHSATWTGLI